MRTPGKKSMDEKRCSRVARMNEKRKKIMKGYLTGKGPVEILLPGTMGWYRCSQYEFETHRAARYYPSGTQVKIGEQEFTL